MIRRAPFAIAPILSLCLTASVFAQAEPGWKSQPLLRGHTGVVQDISFSPDSRWLFSAGLDGAIRVWDLLEWKEKFQLKKVPSPLAIFWGPGGKTVAGFCQDGTLKAWDMPALTARAGMSLQPKNRTPGAPAIFTSLSLPSLSADGAMIAAAENGARGGFVMMGGGGAFVFGFGGGGGGGVVVFGGPPGGFQPPAQDIKIWNATTGKEQRTISVRFSPTLVRFTPDSKDILIGSSSAGEARLFSLATGRELHIFKHKDISGALATPDGKHILTCGLDDLIATTGTIKVWDRETGKEKAVMAEPEGAVTDMALAPDGNLLAAVADFRSVHLWDVSQAKEVGSVAKNTGRLQRLTFSPDGSKLAAVSDNLAVQVWRGDRSGNDSDGRK